MCQPISVQDIFAHKFGIGIIHTKKIASDFVFSNNSLYLCRRNINIEKTIN